MMNMLTIFKAAIIAAYTRIKAGTRGSPGRNRDLCLSGTEARVWGDGGLTGVVSFIPSFNSLLFGAFAAAYRY
jgi:hypothetical protein